MKILVDTNVLIWLSYDRSRLGKLAIAELEDSSNELYASYFSLFEMSINAAVDKMQPYKSSAVDKLRAAGITLIMPDTSMLNNYKVYSPLNRDPFDNMLLTVALQEKLTFMTSDKKILKLQHPGLRLLDARI